MTNKPRVTVFANAIEKAAFNKDLKNLKNLKFCIECTKDVDAKETERLQIKYLTALEASAKKWYTEYDFDSTVWISRKHKKLKLSK